jgi:hypothetical protein
MFNKLVFPGADLVAVPLVLILLAGIDNRRTRKWSAAILGLALLAAVAGYFTAPKHLGSSAALRGFAAVALGLTLMACLVWAAMRAMRRGTGAPPYAARSAWERSRWVAAALFGLSTRAWRQYAEIHVAFATVPSAIFASGFWTGLATGAVVALISPARPLIGWTCFIAGMIAANAYHAASLMQSPTLALTQVFWLRNDQGFYLGSFVIPALLMLRLAIIQGRAEPTAQAARWPDEDSRDVSART